MIQKKSPIFISGSLAYDVIMDFPGSFRDHILPEQLHILNVSFGVTSLQRHFGGTAGNIAFSLKMLGGLPLIAASLGNDGLDYIKHLMTQDIPVSSIKQYKNLPTACAHIMTDRQHNQIAAFYFGALAKVPLRASSILKKKCSLAIIAPTHKDAMLKHLKNAVLKRVPIMFDPGQAITMLSAAELRFCISRSRFLIGNDYEMQLVMTKTGWNESQILKHVSVIIITLGSQGSKLLTRDGEIRVDACRVRAAIDPTGAGDAYRAGFVAGYSRGYNFTICAKIGSVAAAYVVERVGTQHHHFSHTQFRKRYYLQYKERIIL